MTRRRCEQRISPTTASRCSNKAVISVYYHKLIGLSPKVVWLCMDCFRPDLDVVIGILDPSQVMVDML